MTENDFLNAFEVSRLRDAFQTASAPYRYASVGDVFKNESLSRISEEIDKHIESVPEEKNIYASHKKFRQSDMNQMPPLTRKFVSFLNSRPFIEIIESISGINDLHGDPELHGGGIHAISRGGFLKLHTDFNWHSKLGMHRRLNLLVYLSEPWDSSWNGSIELWDDKVTERLFALEPKLGNALLFETNDLSYHGHPDPLASPPGVFRKSIAMYYYSLNRPETDIRYGKSNMTNYAERPGESFAHDKVRRLRHKLQLSTKRLLHLVRRS